MTSVVVVGSVNLDFVVAAPRIPAPGETILGSELVTRPGGKGGNQAVAAARLGAETVLVAAVGDDRMGEDLRRTLAGEGLDVSELTVIAGVSTGAALIVVDERGENSIVVAPGANGKLDTDRITRRTDLLGPGDVLSLQIEVPLATSLEAATRAKRAGASVLLNTAPLPPLPNATLERLLATIDVVVANEGEALALTGATPPADPAGWADLAAGVCGLGPRLAVVTLGEHGAVAAEGGRSYVQPAFAADVVDTTGAGDCFAAAFSVALARGLPTGEALRRACAAGAIATTRLGAQEAMPTADELDRFLE
ncbi:ribokinase [Jiangella asiatica]|uniref:Ribokinase n=1 Tax=Jiangella asiatica TaxID=2530372 RepID=A0A4R5DAL8_9ACTN|nr:ribokinase [Jiangella asiatica]TDE10686.1 ribokinase [Jiangella asiatica]